MIVDEDSGGRTLQTEVFMNEFSFTQMHIG